MTMSQKTFDNEPNLFEYGKKIADMKAGVNKMIEKAERDLVKDLSDTSDSDV